MRRDRARPARARGRRDPHRRQGRARRARGAARCSVVARDATAKRRSKARHLLVATGRQAERRRARSRRRRHQARAARHRGRQAAAHHQPEGLCHRRRRGRAAVHPRGELSRRHRHPARAVPPAGEGERRRDPLGHLHGPGARPCGADRRRRRASATRRSACCAGRSTRTTARRPSARRTATSRWSPTKNGRILGATIVGPHAGELITTWTLAMPAGAEHPRHGRSCGALSDPGGDREARRDQLFHAEFDEPLVAAHHRLPAPLRLNIRRMAESHMAAETTADGPTDAGARARRASGCPASSSCSRSCS